MLEQNPSPQPIFDHCGSTCVIVFRYLGPTSSYPVLIEILPLIRYFGSAGLQQRVLNRAYSIFGFRITCAERTNADGRAATAFTCLRSFIYGLSERERESPPT